MTSVKFYLQKHLLWHIGGSLLTSDMSPFRLSFWGEISIFFFVVVVLCLYSLFPSGLGVLWD